MDENETADDFAFRVATDLLHGSKRLMVERPDEWRNGAAMLIALAIKERETRRG